MTKLILEFQLPIELNENTTLDDMSPIFGNMIRLARVVKTSTDGKVKVLKHRDLSLEEATKLENMPS